MNFKFLSRPQPPASRSYLFGVLERRVGERAHGDREDGWFWADDRAWSNGLRPARA
jgi:hypothetical protein